MIPQFLRYRKQVFERVGTPEVSRVFDDEFSFESQFPAKAVLLPRKREYFFWIAPVPDDNHFVGRCPRTDRLLLHVLPQNHPRLGLPQGSPRDPAEPPLPRGPVPAP